MSFRTYPLDQLMQLTPTQLTTALRLFNFELDGTIAFLSQDPEARRDPSTLSELSNLLTLREVFNGRLEELVAEELERAPLPVTEQYTRNELQTA